MRRLFHNGRMNPLVPAVRDSRSFSTDAQTLRRLLSRDRTGASGTRLASVAFVRMSPRKLRKDARSFLSERLRHYWQSLLANFAAVSQADMERAERRHQERRS